MRHELWAFATGWLAVALLLTANSAAEDAYYRVRLNELEVTEGAWPAGPVPAQLPFAEPRFAQLQRPYVRVDGPGEAFVEAAVPIPSPPNRPELPITEWQLLAKAPAGKELVGRVLFPPTAKDEFRVVHFRVPAEQANADHRAAYLNARIQHYDKLLASGLPGGAWFRRQVLASSEELQGFAPQLLPTTTPRRTWGDPWSLDIFSGQRAISENLALDRLPQGASVGRPTVAVDALKGITVPEVDWKKLLPADSVSLDRLAQAIPADQHAVFWPSLAAIARFYQRYEQLDATMLGSLLPSGQDGGVLRRYEQQLGVPLALVGKLNGHVPVRSVALTGGDLYFVTGTDVAIVLETQQPKLVRDALLATIQSTFAARQDVMVRQGEVGKVAYTSFVSADRTASSYLAAFENAVVVSNSLVQLTRLESCQREPGKSLAELDEFRYFRHRYQLGDEGELAFVFLSDAAIRRWCGPRWRIGAMRRARGLAEVSDLQASAAMELVSGRVEPRDAPPRRSTIDLGKLRIEPNGARSSVYNTLSFATPISELGLDLVTSDEAEAYQRWRVDYELGWRWAFDPIGIRIAEKEDRLTADMTVLPLIIGSQYREWINLTRGAFIPAGAGDRHGALVHATLALNHESTWVRLVDGFSKSYLKTDVLSWLGPTVSLYVDDAPVWQEFARVVSERRPAEVEEWLKQNAFRLPFSMRLDVKDREKAAKFLAALRKWIEAQNLNWFNWGTREYRGQTYTLMEFTRDVESVVGTRIILYILKLEDAIVFSVTEDSLQRAIDRALERQAADRKPPAEDAWAGQNLALEVQGSLPWVAAGWNVSSQLRARQRQAWENLVILNEWQRLFPDLNPQDVHARLWGVRLPCPAGGTYAWNAQLGSLESTVAGHPFRPRWSTQDREPPARHANFRVKFEGEGMRVQAELKK